MGDHKRICISRSWSYQGYKEKCAHGFRRPQLNLTAANFGSIMNAALNTTLKPPFNPYANSVNYLLASYVIPYVGLTGYVGTNPQLQSATAKRLVAGLLGVGSGQDAVIRALLYERLFEKVAPYPYTVAEFTEKISILRNKLPTKACLSHVLWEQRGR